MNVSKCQIVLIYTGTGANSQYIIAYTSQMVMQLLTLFNDNSDRINRMIKASHL